MSSCQKNCRLFTSCDGVLMYSVECCTWLYRL